MRLWVFDIDGTLTDSVALHQKAFVYALEAIGVHKIDTDFKSYKHHTDSYIAKVNYEAYFQQPFGSKAIADFEGLLLDYIEKHTISEIQGALAFIKALDVSKDDAVCFATGSLLKPALFKLTSIGIEGREDLLSAANHHVSREAIVNKAIEKAKKFYQVTDFDVIYSLGDGLWDFLTAQKLGLEFIGIGSQNYEVLQNKGVKVIWRDFLNRS